MLLHFFFNRLEISTLKEARILRPVQYQRSEIKLLLIILTIRNKFLFLFFFTFFTLFNIVNVFYIGIF